MKIEETPEVVRLMQLAEESVELAHAALKLARIQMGYSPTPMTEHEARVQLREEARTLWYVRPHWDSIRTILSSRVCVGKSGGAGRRGWTNG